MSTLRATNIKHESSATNQIVLGADGSIGGTLGDTLAAKVTGSAAGTAPSSPVTGQVWVDTSTNAIKVYDGAAWVDPSNAGGYLSAADVSGTTGSPTTGTYTDADGDWAYYMWTGNGSLTLTKEGQVRAVVVAGGAGGNGAGGVLDSETLTLPVGTHNVVIGAGGAIGSAGNHSRIGTVFVAAGGGVTSVASTAYGGSGGSYSQGTGSSVIGKGIDGQGNNSGVSGSSSSRAGGGGAAAVGGSTSGSSTTGGAGGAGRDISAYLGQSAGTTYVGGGGGGGGSGTGGAGGVGGGGAGSSGWGAAAAGTANTGGAGGGPWNGSAGAGGSGLVIVAVKQ